MTFFVFIFRRRLQDSLRQQDQEEYIRLKKKLSYKYYNKRITTRDNGKVQSHDKEESKLNSTITVNSGAHTLTHD